MEKLRVSRAILVEGKYDRIKLASLIDGLIIPIDGFRIYKDRQKSAMIRALAQKRGLVVVTDSDAAGFQLRGYLRSIAKDADVIHIYIPQVSGKERRKAAPGAEHLLGVEGIGADTLRELFLRSGAVDDTPPQEGARRITRMDFYDDGLMGGPDAAERRAALLRRLGLPNYLTTNALLEIVNSLMSYEEYRRFIGEQEDGSCQ